jgi:hypothetical protein
MTNKKPGSTAIKKTPHVKIQEPLPVDDACCYRAAADWELPTEGQPGCSVTTRLMQPAPNPLATHYWPYWHKALPRALSYIGQHLLTAR